MDQETLSKDQIIELLKNSEIKLKSQDNQRAPQGLKLHSCISLNSALQIEPYIKDAKKAPHVPNSKLISSEVKNLAERYRIVTDPVFSKKKSVEEKKLTAGPNWYNIPRTKLTPEIRRDFKLLQMRDVLDPKRHYKKDKTRSEVPEFSQVGTIIEGPTEYYSGRLTNNERKRTFVEETLHSTKSMQRFKSKYAEIQSVKSSGKKAHYQRLKQMRTKKKFFEK